MIHLAPLLGYPAFPGFAKVEEKFLFDLKTLIKGGVDAILIENNYDIPHNECARPTTIPQLTQICLAARKLTSKPLGLCILWNDYLSALTIAKLANFQFVRIPVFVDRVKTEYGIFPPRADECLAFRQAIKAKNVLIFADVQVKHSKHLIKRTIAAAAVDAESHGADAVIVTGKWTGDPPTVADVEKVKNTIKIPLILGSGITPENITNYRLDGAIVGTYFKRNIARGKHQQNIYPWQTPLDIGRIKQMMASAKKQLNPPTTRKGGNHAVH